MRETIVAAVTSIAAYCQSGLIHSLSIIGLLLLVVGLYRLRVADLVRRNRRLQESVSQTKAELTLAVKTAADAQVALKIGRAHV